MEEPTIPSGWDTYTNTKYNYSFSFPHQPYDAQTLGIVSTDDPKVDLFRSCCMAVIKAQEPEAHYFTLEVHKGVDFEGTVSRITDSIALGDKQLEIQHSAGTITDKDYKQKYFTEPKRIIIQNHPVIIFENQLTKDVVINLKENNIMWLYINKEDPLGKQIFSRLRFNK